MQITITAARGELVRQGLQELGAEVPQIGRRGIRTVMERIKRRTQEYPAERDGQSVASSHSKLGTVYRTASGRYHRTGLLGSRWAIEDAGNGYKLVNTAAHRGKFYAKWVVGDAYGQSQARMHAGRWQVMRDVVDEELGKLPDELEELIKVVSRRVDL